MGRLALKICAVLVLVLGGWWWIATGSMQRGVHLWLDMTRANGFEAEIDRITRSGFPVRIGTTLDGITLIDPAVPTRVEIPQITLTSPIYWPGDVLVDLPAAPVTITTPQAVLTLASQGAQAAMQLHPGSSLQLEALTGTADTITLDLAEGRVLSFDDLQADVVQGSAPETYDIDLTATGFAFGSIIQQALQLPADWPATFEPIVANMTVTFDRPWDRSALRETRPQPRAIRIDRAEAVYADLGITLGADLTVDAGGIPSGKARVQVRNWKQIFDRAVATSGTPPGWAPTVAQMLTMMSDAQGTLDLDITLERGQMRMGFVPLGSAPRLVIP